MFIKISSKKYTNLNTHKLNFIGNELLKIKLGNTIIFSKRRNYKCIACKEIFTINFSKYPYEKKWQYFEEKGNICNFTCNAIKMKKACE